MAQNKTTLSTRTRHENFSHEARHALAEAELRVLSFPRYKATWKLQFRSDEWEQLGGNLGVYCDKEKRNPIQIFMRLRDVSQYRATVELADGLGLLPKSKMNLILDEAGETLDIPRAAPQKPSWNASTNTLKLGDTVIRTIKRPKVATNLLAILNTFEAEGWPERIKDPLPGQSDFQRLAKAIQSLNSGLEQIRFSGDGTGAGITWHPIKLPSSVIVLS